MKPKAMEMAMALGVALLVQRPVSAPAAPANSLRELGPSSTHACPLLTRARTGIDDRVEPEAGRGVAGQTSDQLFELPGDPEVERRFGETVERALDHCFPMSITDALGGAIAGKAIFLPDHLAEKVYGELRSSWRLQCNHPTVRICSGGFETGVGSTTGTSCGVGISGASEARPPRGVEQAEADPSAAAECLASSVRVSESPGPSAEMGESPAVVVECGGCAVRSLIPSQRESARARPGQSRYPEAWLPYPHLARATPQRPWP